MPTETVKHTPGLKQFLKCGCEMRAGIESISWLPCGVHKAAPDLLEALRFLVDASETEPGMAIYRAHLDKAKAAVAEATAFPHSQNPITRYAP